MSFNTLTHTDAVTSLTFARKQHEKTLWIEGEYAVFGDGSTGKPEDLFAALTADGWVFDTVTDRIPAIKATMYDESKPWGERFTYGLHMVKSFCFSKPGSGLFGGWTDAEKREFTRSARAVLRQYGFAGVPTWVKTWQDLI